MSAHAAIPDLARLETNTGIPSSKLGMWLFLAQDCMSFIGLLGAYIVIRFSTPDWPHANELMNITLVTINTFILICSSVTMVYALKGQQDGDYERFNLYLLLTALLGGVFVAIQGVEWYELMIHHGKSAWGSTYGATFYLLTGFHGLHVLIGVIYLLILWAISVLHGRDGRPVYDSGNSMPIEIAGLYWHFVDLVWIVLFTVIYLMPSPGSAVGH